MDEQPRIPAPDIGKPVSVEARELLERIKSYLSASAADPGGDVQREDPSALFEALDELRRARGL